MSLEQWALLFSFIAMALIAASYFVKKGGFLLLQGTGIVFLMASYLCDGKLFAMVGLSIGLIRCLVYYLYEQAGKQASIWWAIGFSAASLAAYCVVNLCILKNAHPADALYLLALFCYAFLFRIRSVKTVRFLSPIPTVLSIVYNAWSQAPLFALISYCFEMVANVSSILKNHVFKKEKTCGNAQE